MLHFVIKCDNLSLETGDGTYISTKCNKGGQLNMGKFEETSRQILENCGGIRNITHVTHCATRLRIEFAKKSQVDVEALKTVPEVAGVVDKGNQVQIIIGPKVNDAYNDFLDVSGWKPGMNADVEVEDPDEKAPRNLMWVVNKFANFVAPVFMPIIPAMIVGGMILAIARIGINYFGLDTSTGTVNILMAIFQAGFTFLPVYVGYTLASQLKMQPIMGAFLGALLITDRINGAEGLSFLGIAIPQVSYGSTVFPIILGVFFMYFVDKGLKKIIPEVIVFFAKPLLTMIIVAPVQLIVLGPIGTICSDAIGNACLWLGDTLGFVSQPILAALYPYMVMFGFDKAMTPISVDLIARIGYNSVTGSMGFISNIAVGATALAVATSIRNNKEQKGLVTSFAITALCGVTEPAFYGALISRPKVLIGTAFGAVCGGLTAGILGLRLYVQGGCPGLTTFLYFVDETGSFHYVVVAAIVAAVTIASAFLGTKFIMNRGSKNAGR